jgi:hypothetical protein
MRDGINVEIRNGHRLLPIVNTEFAVKCETCGRTFDCLFNSCFIKCNGESTNLGITPAIYESEGY